MPKLPVDTAVIVPVGPCIDDTDYKTLETVAYDAAGISVSLYQTNLTGVTTETALTLTAAGAQDWTEIAGGYHQVEITAAQNDTEGVLWVAGIADGVLAFESVHFEVVPIKVFDSLVLGTDSLEVDTVSVSGDTVAADNLELQFDGTGITDPTFPATQASVANIGAASGGAFNFSAVEDNTSAAIIDGVVFVGTVTGGTFADLEATNGVTHDIDDDTDVIDIVYGYLLGGGKVATKVTVVANVDGNVDEMLVKIYDHIGAAWDTIGTLDGSGGTSYVTVEAELLQKHTGTGGELGKVYIRLDSDTTTPSSISVDKLLIAGVNASQTAGYALGAFWVSEAGTSGQELYVNGTVEKPCPWADAVAMNAALPLKRFNITAGDTVTLSASAAGYTLFGEAWTLALGGQSIAGASFTGAEITGVGVNGATHPHFHHCEFGAVTCPPGDFHDCGFGVASGAFVGGSAGEYVLHECYSKVPGSGSPEFSFSGLGPSTGINNRGWTGGFTCTLDGDCTISHEPLAGGRATFTTGGADVEIRGTTRAITLVLSNAGTVQFVGTTGPITISGTATTVVNLYGICADVADTSVGTSLTDRTVCRPSINAEADAAILDAGLVAQHAEILAASGGSSGAFAITLHTQDTAGDAVPQVSISLRDEPDTSLLRLGVSSLANGDLPISIDAGTYQVHQVKSGHDPVSSPQQIVVTADATINLIIDPIVISAPSDPTKCTIFGRIAGQGGGVKNVRVRASSIVPSVAQGLQQHSETFETLTDENGDFELDLTRLSVVALTIDYVGYETTNFLVPDLGTQDIATWAPIA